MIKKTYGKQRLHNFVQQKIKADIQEEQINPTTVILEHRDRERGHWKASDALGGLGKEWARSGGERRMPKSIT